MSIGTVSIMGTMLWKVIHYLNSNILNILTIKLRTTAINLFRMSYITSFINRPIKQNDSEYGLELSELKRISLIITIFCNNVIIIIKDLLSLIPKLIFIVRHFNIFYLIVVFFNIFCNFFIIKYSPKYKIDAIRNEEKLNIKMIALFQSHALIKNIDWENINQIFNKESAAYEKSINIIKYIKIIIALGNIMIIIIFYYFFIEYISIDALTMSICFDLRNLLVGITIPITNLLSYSRSWQQIKINKKIHINKDNDIICTNLSIYNILKNINLNIYFGDKIVLIGDNGQGKSLLCKVLAGIESDFTGNVTTAKAIMLKNVNITSQLNKEKLCQIYPEYEMLLKESNTSRGQDNFIASLFAVESDANLLIFDETFENLDNSSTNTIIDILLKINKTVIIVTHKDNIIAKFSKIYRIKSGQIFY